MICSVSIELAQSWPKLRENLPIITQNPETQNPDTQILPHPNKISEPRHPNFASPK
jgi:hypothetical protein